MVDITFHGTRGSFPTYGPSYIKYGGHTSCVSITTKSQWIIFDAGTGLIDASKINSLNNHKNCHLFLSHLHLDHLVGLPSFTKLWDPNFTLNIYSGITSAERNIRQIVAPPYFPVDWRNIPCIKNIINFTPGENLITDNDCSIETLKLSHPGGCSSFKLRLDGLVLCYITDTDLPKKLQEQLISFIHKCDLLIFDSTYCDSEYGPVSHFGHSTWQMACDLAKQGKVKLLALFHHDPGHTDDMIDQIEFEAQKIFPNTFAARCGQKLSLPE